MSEAHELACVARGGNHEGAVLDGLRKVSRPPFQRDLTEVCDEWFRSFAFAPWCQHPARKPGAGLATEMWATLYHLDRGSVLSEFKRGGKAGDASADDRNTHR